ncbi:MAG: NAD(P)/FAD-dependent oxidoreductase [Dethiobacteria bacterium]|jgi:NADPH-dependent 2,4-dienoyl-CoA reductase/sulfur reductase-like enzyme
MNLQGMDIDVAVIGAGPAGMAAAIKAREKGAENVLIIERDTRLGGLLHQCIHNGFGLLYFGENLTGPEYSHRFTEKLLDTGAKALMETMVLRISGEKEITAVNRRDGLFTIKPKSIVLAMGCRERSRGNINLHGTRPAGVLTAGTAQRLVNIEGFLPGKKIVILGTGDIGMIMARRLTLEGAEVKAAVEILPYAGGLIRNEVQCLHDFKIPVFLQHTVTKIYGEKRVRAVDIAALDANNNPIPETKRTIECDTLLLSVGLIPENELSTAAGIKLDPVTGGAVVNEARQTNVEGIFAGGNVLHVHDLVDNVSWESEIAGEYAARFAGGEKPPAGQITLKAGRNIRYVLPQIISGKNNVDLYLRVREPQKKVIIKMGGIQVGKTIPGVKPSSMIKLDLSAEDLQKFKRNEIVIDCLTKGD